MTGQKRKILVIDDDLGMIRVLEKHLNSQNYDMIGALNGKDGIARAGEGDIDCILLDVMMPNLSGAEVTRILQKNPVTKEIPIIFITVTISKKEDKVDKEIEVDGKLYPAFAKPLYFPKLMSVIRQSIKE